jgi:hypothetical protein
VLLASITASVIGGLIFLYQLAALLGLLPAPRGGA